MKKNFFKKLSFVVALAMIISTVAPAAGAFAATAPKLNATEKYLFLGTSTNKYDFNISNKKSGWKYEWSSSDEDVATVASNGLVTAEAIGTAKVSVLITNKGKEVDTLDATVIVKDNIATLKITNTPAGDKLAVGKENDFNRSYVTVSGSTTATTGITRWSVDSKDATISDSGLFVANKAGEYTITARAFQSKTKYSSWLVDNTKYASYVTATATYKVTVTNEITDVKAVSVNSFNVNFKSEVSKVEAKNFAVTNATTKIAAPVKSVTLSTDKKSAVVVLFNNMTNGSTYSVKATVDGSEVNGSFAFVQGTPAKITAPTTQVILAGTATAINYTVLDENGLDITAATTVFYATAGLSGASVVSGKITLANGVSEYVTVSAVNTTTGVIVKSEPIKVTGSNAAASTFVGYTVVTSQPNTWDAVNVSVPVNAFNYKVYVNVTDSFGTSAYNNLGVTFESLDPSIFIVDAATGVVTPVSVGVGSFRIHTVAFDVVKTISITAAPVASTFTASANSVKVSATNVALDVVSETLGLKDQYGKDINAGNAMTVKLLAGANLVTVNGTALATVGASTSATTGTAFTIGAVDQPNAGYAVLQVTTRANNTDFSQIINVTIGKKDTIVAAYGITGLKDLDRNAKFTWTATDYANYGKTTVSLAATNAEGYVVNTVSGGTITIAGPNGYSETLAGGSVLDATQGDAYFDGVVNYTNPNKYPVGAYTATGYVTGSAVGFTTASFNIKDTGVAPVVTVYSNQIFGTYIQNGNLQGLTNFPTTAGGFLNITFQSSNNGVLPTQVSKLPLWQWGGSYYRGQVNIPATCSNFPIYNVTVDVASFSGPSSPYARIWANINLGTFFLTYAN